MADLTDLVDPTRDGFGVCSKTAFPGIASESGPTRRPSRWHALIRGLTAFCQALEVSNSILNWTYPVRVWDGMLQVLKTSVHAIQLLADDTKDTDDGAPLKTVKLSYRGIDYEVDLSEKNATALGNVLAPYLDVARRTNKARTTEVAATKLSIDAPRPHDIRRWAKSHGMDVADRGRLPADVTYRYLKAHGG